MAFVVVIWWTFFPLNTVIWYWKVIIGGCFFILPSFSFKHNIWFNRVQDLFLIGFILQYIYWLKIQVKYSIFGCFTIWFINFPFRRQNCLCSPGLTHECALPFDSTGLTHECSFRLENWFDVSTEEILNLDNEKLHEIVWNAWQVHARVQFRIHARVLVEYVLFDL